MSRRSRRSKREGGPQFSGPSRGLLPLAHESVRQAILGLADGPLPLWRGARPLAAVYLPRARARDWMRRVVSYTPPLAKPAEGRLSRGRYSALRLLRMAAPARVRFCVQRKVRREVLFAKGRGGYGGHGRYFRNASSQYSCGR